MGHTNSTTAFARGRHTKPAEAMDLGDETKDVWLVITESKALFARLVASPIRHIMYRLRATSGRSDPLESLSRIIVTMAAVGYPESTVDLLIAHLQGVKIRCYPTGEHRPLRELDLEEAKLEATENKLTIMRLHAGETVTPEHLIREADVNEREALLQMERARALRYLAKVPTRVLPFPTSVARPMGVMS